MPVIRQPDKARDNKDRRISQDVERSRRIAAEVTYLIIFKYRHTVVPVPRYHLRYNISPLFTFPFFFVLVQFRGAGAASADIILLSRSHN